MERMIKKKHSFSLSKLLDMRRIYEFYKGQWTWKENRGLVLRIIVHRISQAIVLIQYNTMEITTSSWPGLKI